MKNILSLCLLGLVPMAYAQTSQTSLTYAMPSLLSSPNVRSAGMADAAVATSPDTWSIYDNAAKYAFQKSKAGVAFSYNPWLPALVDGQNQFAATGYYQINDRFSVASSISFLNMGDMPGYDENGQQLGETSAHDLAVNVAASYRINKHLSVGATVKWLNSSLAKSNSLIEEDVLANGIAFDLSLYYNRSFQLLQRDAQWSLGVALKNLGPKIAYLSGKDFLPAQAVIGGAVKMDIATNHSLELGLDLSKTLVASNAAYQADGALKNMIRSLGNHGFFQSITYATGLEYAWKDCLFARTGYFNESERYGNRKFVSFGLGGKYANFFLNASYAINVAAKPHGYINEWKVGIGYEF